MWEKTFLYLLHAASSFAMCPTLEVVGVAVAAAVNETFTGSALPIEVLISPDVRPTRSRQFAKVTNLIHVYLRVK